MKHTTLVILLALAPLSWSDRPSIEDAVKNAVGTWILSNQDADTDCVWDAPGFWLMVEPKPEYPRRARRKEVTGSVTLEYDVYLGIPKNIRILETKLSRPYPPKTFEKAAISTISKYRYKPLVRDGEVYNVRDVRCRIDFKL